MSLREHPYRVSGSVRRSQSGWGFQDVYPNLEAVISELARLFRLGGAKIGRLKLERFEGDRWVRVPFKLSGVFAEVDGESVLVCPFDEFEYADD